MAIKIKRSTGNTAPAELAAGQLAYVEGSTNGGTLYYGEISGTVREIAGRKYVDKLNGIEAGAQVNTVTSVAGKTGAVTLSTSDVSNAESTANKGQANGYASLDSSGKVPSTQLPSYVDDVKEYANLAAFPGTGETDKIYVAIDTGKTYRWSGSTYVEISASPGSTDAVSEGSTNLYFTTARARESISATQNVSYDNSTGVITGPDLSGYATSASLATVATSGSYDDLDDKPSIPTAVSDLTNDSGFITAVADDTTPALGGDLNVTGFALVSDADENVSVQPGANGVLVLSESGTGHGGITGISGQGISIASDSQASLAYTANNLPRYQQDGAPINEVIASSDGVMIVANTSGSYIEISDNDGGGVFINSAAAVRISGLYYPTADGTAGQVLVTDGSGNLSWDDAGGSSFSGSYNDLTDKPTLFSGSYNDLTDKPTLFSGSYTDLTNKPTLVTAFTGLSDVPSSYTAKAGFFVRVNSGATALEFTQDIDDGTF